MPKFEPSFDIKPLQQVTPGTPVIFENVVAFAGVNRDVPAAQQAVVLAAHDAAQGAFMYRYFGGGQPDVLVPTGEIIIRPDLHTLAQNVSIAPASTKLFVAEEHFITVQVPGSVRLLGLTDGTLVPARLSQMAAFTSWEIGVMSLGQFVPLLKV